MTQVQLTGIAGSQIQLSTNAPRDMNIMIYGGGTFAQETLRKLKDEHWVNVDWFSGSTAESRHIRVKKGSFSYGGLIDTIGLDEMKGSNRLRTHTNLDSFLDNSSDADLILFLSGPHDRYTNTKKKIRGPGTENFYEKLLLKTSKKLKTLSIGLERKNYSKGFWVISNPVGALCLLAREYGATSEDQISSISCQGFRAAKLIAQKLYLNKEARERFELDKVPIDMVYEFPIVGEHHTPIFLFEYCQLKKAEEPETMKLFDVLPDSQRQYFQYRFRKKIQKKAEDTMFVSSKQGIGYSEAPDTVFGAIKRIAYNSQPRSYDGVYHFDKETGAYLMGPARYNFETEQFVPVEQELSKNKAALLNHQAKNQKAQVHQVIDSYRKSL